MVFPIAKAFSTVVEETYWMKLQEQSERAFNYLTKIPITQWQNMQWITTRKIPLPERLPAWYGIVTSNTSESINSMIDEL